MCRFLRKVQIVKPVSFLSRSTRALCRVSFSSLRLFILAVVLGCAIGSTNAQSTCAEAFKVGTGVEERIYRTGITWYTAFTYDLPMHVVYIPDHPELAPDTLSAEIDFKCDGPLARDIADAIGEPGDDSYVELPIIRNFKKTNIDGKIAYVLDIEARYRNMMAGGGITRNVQAWVMIDVPSAGDVTIQPDLNSRACLNETEIISLPRTIPVQADDEETVFMLPFSLWTEDSVRFIWNGIHEPLEVWVAKQDCHFLPVSTDENFLGHRTIKPEDTWKLTVDSIDNLIGEWTNGGMYYVKFISKEAAELKIEIVPEKEVDGTRLRYDEKVKVKRDAADLFYFSTKWEATRFTTPSKHICTAYFGTTPEIDISNPATYFDSVRMDIAADGSHYLEFSNTEMKEWICSHSTDGYVYMRLRTNRSTSLTASAWTDANDCAIDNSWQLRSGRPIQFDANKYIESYIYRMRYADWQGYDINVERTDNTGKTLDLGMWKKCSTSKPTKAQCISKSFKSTSGATSWTIPQADVDKWGNSYPSADGVFYYWNFNFNKAASAVVFTSGRPEEVEPEEPDCEVTVTAGPQTPLTGTVQITVEY